MAAVDIGNRGLQKLGAKRVASLSENSVNARAVNAVYDRLRRALLREYRWNFSTARAELAADSTDPDWGRAYSYTLPADFICLRPDYPEDNLNSKDWQIEGKKILTDDTAPLNIRYTYDVTDTEEMDALFQEVLATDIALELCEELTQSNTKKEGLRADRKDAISRARKSNSFENVAQFPPEDTWVTCRD